MSHYSHRDYRQNNRSARMFRLLLTSLAILATLAQVGAELASEFRTDFEEVVLIHGLDEPTDLNFAPDGSDLLLVSVRSGIIYAVTGSASARHEYDVDKYEIANLADKMCHNGSRGLVGVSFHPKFSSTTSVQGDDTMWIYVFYTAVGKGKCYTGGWTVDELPAPRGTVNILSRFPVIRSTTSGRIELDMKNEHILLQTAMQMTHTHNGGDIAFGSDGMLYLSLGDGLTNKLRNDQGLPYNQALDVLFGKIVRLTPEGDIPRDNPYTPANGYNDAIFCGKNGGFSGSSDKPCAEVYASGLRNPFRFAFDPNKAAEDGSPRLWINDVGGSRIERIVEGKKGGNYGYPDMRGPCENDYFKMGEKKSSRCKSPQELGFDPSVHWYQHDSERGGCITGGAFVPSNISWPNEFEGSYVHSEFKMGGIHRLSPGGAGCPYPECEIPVSAYNENESTKTEFSDATAVVSMAFGPYSGSTPQALYFLSMGAGRKTKERGRPQGLVRISYLGMQHTNNRPIAEIDANVTVGFNPLVVHFDGTRSTDREDSLLSYAWDFDGDGEQDGEAKEESFVYKNPGVYQVTLTVTDGGNATDTTTIDVTVDNAPPVPTIESPSGNEQFAVGDSIRLVGSAIDSEDGLLPPSSFTWEIREYHGDHYHHIMKPKFGSDVVTFVMRGPAGFEAIESSYVKAVLTATDSRGLSSTAAKILRPKLHSVAIDSSPSGLDVMVYNQIVKTPATVVAWENQEVEIDAIGDETGSYAFKAWSDGGARSHSFTVNPSASLDIVAYFQAVEKEPASITIKDGDDMREKEGGVEDITSLVVSDNDADEITIITAKLLDFSILITLNADGKNQKSSDFLNENLDDAVSEALLKELKMLVKSLGMPYAKPIDINLTRKKKKEEEGHDDGKRYEVLFEGTTTFRKKQDQRLPSFSAIQNMQKQALVRIGNNLVDVIEESAPGAAVASVVTNIVHSDPTSKGGVTKSESRDIENWNGFLICIVLVGTGIVAFMTVFIIRNKIMPPTKKEEESSDRSETGEASKEGHTCIAVSWNPECSRPDS